MKKIEIEEKEIKHFGVVVSNWRKYLKINREEYAIIDNKNHFLSDDLKTYRCMEKYKDSKEEFQRKMAKSYFSNYLTLYTDDTLTMYTNDYCINHQKRCLTNYDLNMKFFSTLNHDEFNKSIDIVTRKFKKMEEVLDLQDLDKCSGIYMLILDKYSQVYVGETADIRKRIIEHWRNKKEFDKLIFGTVETSVISIDSFGALDTTRIFVYRTKGKYDNYDIEEKITKYIPEKYLLNRTRGGFRGNSEIEVMIDTFAHRNGRKLK